MTHTQGESDDKKRCVHCMETLTEKPGHDGVRKIDTRYIV